MTHGFLAFTNEKNQLEVVNVEHIIDVFPTNSGSTETPQWNVCITLTGNRYVRCNQLESVENILHTLDNISSTVKTDPAQLLLGYTSK